MKYVIFDMDGVIVDSEYDHAIANIRALKKFGLAVDMDYVYRFVGTTLAHMMEQIVKEEHLSVTSDELIVAANAEKDAIIDKDGYRHVPGTATLIQTLVKEGYSLAIASSSTPVEIKRVTDYFKITDCFDAIVSGSYVKNPKPAPDIFIKAMDMLNAKPTDCVVIEDSTVGIEAAKSAGIKTIGYANPHSGNQDLSHADYVAMHMSDCMKFIKRD